jgi:hypothetical protein
MSVSTWVQAGAAQAAKQTGTNHLKRKDELPRSVERAKRMEMWVDNHREEIEAGADTRSHFSST